MYHTDDTIVAIATAPGGAARGIVRVSGPATLTVLESCVRPRSQDALRSSHSATVFSGSVTLGGSRIAELPADVYLWPDRRSYTRQPVAEIHTIGSPPLLSAIVRTLCAAGARPAEAGEFTLRAFLAGRVDLTQAEAVLGIIDARGEDDLRSALAQLAGGLAQPLARLRSSLLDLLSHLEAGLDFAEEDIPFIAPDEIARQLDEAMAVVMRLKDQLTRRRQCDEPPRAALVGWPNVGKSSLFNALAGHGAALVSNEPGTTRDYLTTTLDLDGLRCRLIDTAGVQSADRAEPVALAAQRMAAAQARDCEIRLFCVDSTRPLNDGERSALTANKGAGQLVVLTKCDRPTVMDLPCGAIATSAASGRGLDGLRQALRQVVERVPTMDAATGATAERCAQSVRAAADSLARAADANRRMAGEELIAAELRLALDELGRVAGVVCSDDILDRVFSRFCIGK